MSHSEEFRGAEELGVHVCCVEFAEDLSSLFLNVVQDHQEVLTLLGMSRVVVGHYDDCAIAFHYDGGKFEGDPELLSEGDKEIEFLGQGEYCAGLGVGGRGCNRGLFDAAVVEGAGGATERDVVSGVAFAVRVEELGSVDFAV